MSDTSDLDKLLSLIQKPPCSQCLENAKWNLYGGYVDSDRKCLEYCDNGHEEAAQ